MSYIKTVRPTKGYWLFVEMEEGNCFKEITKSRRKIQ